MTPWSKGRFGVLEERVMATMEGKRPAIDVPYYIYRYDPSEEILALHEFTNFVKRLRSKGYSAETVWVSEIMIQILEKLRFLDSKGRKVEQSNRNMVKQDLERILPRELAEELKSRLGMKSIGHCAALLRCGSLFPFVHISSLLVEITGAVNCTLVIAYPGDKEGRMLNEKTDDVRTYYRAEII